MLDTLKARHNLIDVGFDEKQAEVIIEIEQQKQDEIATKDFVRAEISDAKSQLKTEIAEFKTEIKTEIAEFKTEVKTEIAEFKTEVKTEIGKITTQINTLNKFMYLSLGFMFTSLGGILLTLIKLFFLD